MKRKALAMICGAALLMSHTTALAAPAELSLNPSNSWSVTRNGGGRSAIPYLTPEIMK